MYENSDDNIFCYSMGVMGKRKYMKVRHPLSFKKALSKGKRFACFRVANCCVPALLLYYKLVEFLDSVQIGTLHSVREELCFGFTSEHKINVYLCDLMKFMPRLT